MYSFIALFMTAQDCKNIKLFIGLINVRLIYHRDEKAISLSICVCSYLKAVTPDLTLHM